MSTLLAGDFFSPKFKVCNNDQLLALMYILIDDHLCYAVDGSLAGDPSDAHRIHIICDP
jgi:hypothetical protein